MKLHQSIAVCLGLMVGVAADGCFAQSAANQTESVAVGTASQDPAVAVPAVTPAPSGSLGKTREQATGELEDFQKSGQAAQMGGLYRGSKQRGVADQEGVSTIESSSACSGPSVLDI